MDFFKFITDSLLDPYADKPNLITDKTRKNKEDFFRILQVEFKIRIFFQFFPEIVTHFIPIAACLISNWTHRQIYRL